MLWSWWAISGLLWVWRNRRGPHLEGRQDLRLPLCFVLRQLCPCSVGAVESGLVLSEEGNPAGLSSCSGGLRPLVELRVEPAGLCRRCTGVAVPLRVVPSLTGWPSKRCPGIGFSSTADREIRVVQHGAPARGLSRISSRGRPHPEGRRAGREPLPDHAGESTLLSRTGEE